jgi:hypothetical protein
MVAHGPAVKEAREPTKTDLRKAKATGTTATEATIVEEEPTEAMEEVPVKTEKETNNMRADLLTCQRRRCSAKSANGQIDHGILSPTTTGAHVTTQEATWKATVPPNASIPNGS